MHHAARTDLGWLRFRGHELAFQRLKASAHSGWRMRWAFTKGHSGTIFHPSACHGTKIRDQSRADPACAKSIRDAGMIRDAHTGRKDGKGQFRLMAINHQKEATLAVTLIAPDVEIRQPVQSTIVARVAARSSASVMPSAVSTMRKPPSTTSRTPRLVMIRSTTPFPVRGSVHSGSTLLSPCLLV